MKMIQMRVEAQKKRGILLEYKMVLRCNLT